MGCRVAILGSKACQPGIPRDTMSTKITRTVYDSPDNLRNPVEITVDVLNSVRTNGAFTSATCRALGVSAGHTKKGWAKALIGKWIEQENLQKAREGVGVYGTKKGRRKAEMMPVIRPPHKNLPIPPAPKWPTIDKAYSREKYLDFLASQEWRELRVLVLANSGRRCCLCRETEGPIQVDHIIPASVDWSRRLDYNNLQVLCKECNLGKGNKYTDDWRN